MTRKQYRRRKEFFDGYRFGYSGQRLTCKAKQSHTIDYLRGYTEGKRDQRDGETPLL